MQYLHCSAVDDLALTASTVPGRSQTLTHTVERFHSVRKCLSHDGCYTNTCGTGSGDDLDVYSHRSFQRLSNIEDLTVSDVDVSTDDDWVRSSVELL